jgi:predicted ferric reductase
MMWFLFLLYLVLPVIQLIVFLSGQWAYGPGAALNFGASIMALHWLLANAIIAAKVPWLQRTIPYDKRVTLHVFSSFGLIVAIAWHAAYKAVIGANFNLVTWVLLAMLAMFFAVAVLWIPVPGFRRARSALLKLVRRSEGLSYDRTKTMHRSAAMVLTILLFLHVVSAGLFDSIPFIAAAGYWVLFIAAVGLPVLTAAGTFRTQTIVTHVTRRGDIVEVEVEPAAGYSYRAGQFAFLRSRNADGALEEHPFSFLSSPGEKGIRFGIRMSGDFTTHVASFSEETKVSISRPFGNFRPRNDGPVCLIGSGVGTVPIVSLLKELARNDNRPVLAFLSVDRQEQILDREQLLEIHDGANAVDIRMLVYEEDGIRFSKDYFRRTIPNPNSYSYYLCSSSGVRSAVTTALAALGVGRSAISFETFSLG